MIARKEEGMDGMEVWIDSQFAKHINEIRNLHLYDKIDPTSQAAGQSAIGQVMVSPQTAFDITLTEAGDYEPIIERLKSRGFIQNINFIEATESHRQLVREALQLKA